MVNQIYNIINSLPADHQLNKQQLGQIFGAVSGSVGTFMGLFNTFKIKKISAGVGKKINTTIDITKLNTEHLDNLQIFMNTILNIITAMLKETQLLSEIKIFLENAHKCNLYHQHGPTSTKQKTFSGFINTWHAQTIVSTSSRSSRETNIGTSYCPSSRPLPNWHFIHAQ